MYETIIDNVRGTIESKSFDGENMIVKGWAFSELNSVCPIRCKYNNTIVSTNPEARETIANTFIKKNILMCGWTTILPKNKYVDAQIKIDDEWFTFLCFNTFDELNKEVVETAAAISNIRLADHPIQVNKEPLDITPKKHTFIHFGMNSHKSNIYIIDNFYVDPDNIREYGLEHLNNNENNVMSKVIFYKTKFEDILASKIQSLNKHNINGIFTNKIEYIPNTYQYLAIICLTPDASVNSGLTLHIKKEGEKVQSDIIRNIYNRLIILNTKTISNIDFTDMGDSSLVQLFAFDLE